MTVYLLDKKIIERKTRLQTTELKVWLPKNANSNALIRRELKPRPHVNVFMRKRILFSAFWLPVHMQAAFSVAKNDGFQKRSPKCSDSKTPDYRFRMDDESGDFGERWHHSLGGPNLLRMLSRQAIAYSNRCCIYVWMGWETKTISKTVVWTENFGCVFIQKRIRVDGAWTHGHGNPVVVLLSTDSIEGGDVPRLTTKHHWIKYFAQISWVYFEQFDGHRVSFYG